MTRFTTDVQMRFRDIDGMGHVNHAVFLSYAEMARTQFYMKVAKKERLEDIDFILAHVDIDFESQAVWGDQVRVAVWPSKIGTSSFALRYEITETRDRPCARPSEERSGVLRLRAEEAETDSSRFPQASRSRLGSRMSDRPMSNGLAATIA